MALIIHVEFPIMSVSAAFSLSNNIHLIVRLRHVSLYL